MITKIEDTMLIRRPQPSLKDPEAQVMTDHQILIDGQIQACSAGKFVTEVKRWDQEGREVELTHRERVLGFAILMQRLNEACRKASCHIEREEEGEEEYFRCKKSIAPRQLI